MNWTETILAARPPEEIWSQIFAELLRSARSTTSPVALHQSLVPADRLLAESAWELWSAYQNFSGRTSARLVDWWTNSAAGGRAVLVLDALSLRDLPALLGGAQARGITPAHVNVTGAEVPSDTTPFAKALGVSSRASLKNNRAPGTFRLSSSQLATDVFNLPFADCSVPPARDVFIWHEFQDDDVHSNKPSDAVFNHYSAQLQSAEFWEFVNRLRQGRKLVITADHGYATSQYFSTNITEPEMVAKLRDDFSASRFKPSTTPWDRFYLPPIVLDTGTHHVLTGQISWAVAGGFPKRCHGGLTLLEVAVPWVELPPL